MKAFKLILGTVLGLVTVGYVVQFVQVLVHATFSPISAIDVSTSLAAILIGIFFTQWAFRSALGKHTPEEPDEVVDMSLAPNATVTRLFIVLIPLCFWIPVLGPVVGWIGIRRARWVQMPDWIALLLACLFFVSLFITFFFAIFLWSLVRAGG